MSEKILFEILKEATLSINVKGLALTEINPYGELIKDTEDEIELNRCFNSSEIHHMFKHLIMKRFLKL